MFIYIPLFDKITELEKSVHITGIAMSNLKEKIREIKVT